MKKTKIIYWIFTALLGLSMLATAIPEIINGPDAIKFMTALGYPPYMNLFLGITKILAVIAIVVPRFPRIKEWAYAGICFDLIGATYSQIAIGTLFNNWIFMIIFFIPLFGSYIYYHKKLKGVQ